MMAKHAIMKQYEIKKLLDSQKKPKTKVQFRLPERLFKKLKIISENTEVSMNAIVVKAVEEFLK